jgi:hypothetical protein
LTPLPPDAGFADGVAASGSAAAGGDAITAAMVAASFSALKFMHRHTFRRSGASAGQCAARALQATRACFPLAGEV